MARQSQTPVVFQKSVRDEQGVLMSSGRAGVVLPVAYFPLLRGDSCSGRFSLDVSLAEMPRPLLNAVFVNVQAWFVPKPIFPQFAGLDEFYASYTGETIKALGSPDRVPPKFFNTALGSLMSSSVFFQTLGLHVDTTKQVNTDLIDAFNVVYNFRLAAHSSKLQRKSYFSENAAAALELPRAFWPSGRFSRVVPDYERALVIGSLDLDVSAGRLPLKNMIYESTSTGNMPAGTYIDASTGATLGGAVGARRFLGTDTGGTSGGSAFPKIWAEMAGETVTSSLADIDKARLTQSFAKLRAAYAGNDPTGFGMDDTILAHVMQGLFVPEEFYKRPWLLDSSRVPFGFNERFATDSAALDQSVTTGATSVSLSLNVPTSQVGGMVVITMEVLPERLDERQTDEFLYIDHPDDLPNALRDIQNPEPVDFVLNRRLDAKHATPDGLYGYEPMNDVWNRSFTRLGGVFYQPDPAAPVTEQRSGIWQAQVVNPVFSADHWLAPQPFPHYVFSDTQAPAFEFVARHTCKVVGLTQIGDVLAEDNDNFEAVEGADNSATTL